MGTYPRTLGCGIYLSVPEACAIYSCSPPSLDSCVDMRQVQIQPHNVGWLELFNKATQSSMATFRIRDTSCKLTPNCCLECWRGFRLCDHIWSRLCDGYIHICSMFGDERLLVYCWLKYASGFSPDWLWLLSCSLVQDCSTSKWKYGNSFEPFYFLFKGWQLFLFFITVPCTSSFSIRIGHVVTTYSEDRIGLYLTIKFVSNIPSITEIQK